MLVAQWDRVHPWPHGQLGGVFNVDNFPDILDVSYSAAFHYWSMLMQGHLTSGGGHPAEILPLELRRGPPH